METAQGAAGYQLFVGVDIAAATAMAAWQPVGGKVGRPVQIAQSPEGHAALHEKLSASGVPAGKTLVVLEATGSSWITLATTLAQWGYAVAVINPSQAHDFAKAAWCYASCHEPQSVAGKSAHCRPGVGTSLPLAGVLRPNGLHPCPIFLRKCRLRAFWALVGCSGDQSPHQTP